MGSRKGSSTQNLLGKRKRRVQADLQSKLKRAPPKVVAESAFAAIATASPSIAAAYLAYRVAKFIVPVIEKGAKEYNGTGDKEKAKEKMKEEIVKQTGKEIRDAAIGTVVGAAMDSANVPSTGSSDKAEEAAKKFVEEAVSGTISEVLENE